MWSETSKISSVLLLCFLPLCYSQAPCQLFWWQEQGIDAPVPANVLSLVFLRKHQDLFKRRLRIWRYEAQLCNFFTEQVNLGTISEPQLSLLPNGYMVPPKPPSRSEKPCQQIQKHSKSEWEPCHPPFDHSHPRTDLPEKTKLRRVI